MSKRRESDNEMVEEVSQHVTCVIDDVHVKYDRGRYRKDTVFYWTVQGGNLDLVTQAMAAMRERKMEDEIEWLLNTSITARRRCCAGFFSCIQTALLVPMQLLFLLLTCLAALTPFFPLYHEGFSAAFSRKRYKANCCDLPLYMAAQSRDPRMVELFRDQGVRLDVVERCNNVFHIIANSSSSSLRIYQLIVSAYSSQKTRVREAVLKQTNGDGLTALELCVKYGPPELLDAMLSTEGLILTTVVNIRSSSFDVDEGCLLRRGRPEYKIEGTEVNSSSAAGEEMATEAGDATTSETTSTGYRRLWYDVTDYESGGWFHKQSLPLLLLANRNLESSDTEAESLWALWANQLLVEWCALKAKALNVFIAADCVFRVGLASLACYYAWLVSRHDAMLPLVGRFAKESANIRAQWRSEELLKSIANATSPVVLADPCLRDTAIVAGTPVDACEMQALENIQTDCVGIDLKALLDEYVDDRLSDLWYIDGLTKSILDVLTAVAVFQLVMQSIKRLAFVGRNVKSYSLDTGLRRIFVASLPGSRADEFLVAMSACMVIIVQGVTLKMNSTEYLTEELVNYIRSINLLYAGYILCVLMSFLWSMRLMPRMGYFVLITGKLVRCLVQFLVVFGLFFVAMSILFHYAMREEDCELKIQPAFATVADSMYETYKVLFGHGDFFFDANLSTKLLYIVYSFYCILLILNFIIAIMSATADALMSRSWKHCNWQREFLSEYLSHEIALNAMLLVCGAHSSFLRYLGYQVVKPENGSDESRAKIYIEIERTTEAG